MLTEPPTMAAPSADAPGAQVTRGWQGAVTDAANKGLGRAGEEWVCGLERRELEAAGRPDLGAKVEWASRSQGDGLGYDIRSFDLSGDERWVEVKTTNCGRSTPFLLSPNELAVWRSNVACYRLFRVYSFAGDRRLYRLAGDPDRVLTLTAAAWEARVGADVAESAASGASRPVRRSDA